MIYFLREHLLEIVGAFIIPVFSEEHNFYEDNIRTILQTEH